MKIRTIVKEVPLPYPPETVWAFLLNESAWAGWWYDDTPLTEVTPGWELGATLRFGSEWAPSIEELSPPNTLAFGGHRFELSGDGRARTLLQWSNSRPAMAESEFDPMYSMEEEVDAQLADAMDVALGHFSAALEELEAGREEVSEMAPADPGPNPTPREIRVFVSSTFKDLQAEREELTKRSFFELRNLCEERGVSLTDIDLRWGITDEQKAEGKVLSTCLEVIDDCRPYFIGILGERYGWVPEELPPDQVDRAPWLADGRGRSVTEMEIIHGVLNDPGMAAHAFFYLRDPNFIETLPPDERPDHLEGPTPEEIQELGHWTAEERASQRRQRLAELKARIESSGLTVRRFKDPQELAALVANDMKRVVEQHFPAGSAPGRRESSALLHEAFIKEARRTYVPRPSMNQRLDDHVQGGGGPMVVTGEAGSGKSALLANWIHEYRERFPEGLIIPHFVGSAADSSAWDRMLGRFLDELSIAANQEFEAPKEPQALRQAFARALHAAAARQPILLVVDGLNELEDRDQALELAWLPPELPDGVTVVLSTLPGPSLEEAERRGFSILEVPPLEPEDQLRLIHDYLGRYKKSLSDVHADGILRNDQGGNPLFLRTVLEELRLHGDHATIGQVIDHYMGSPDLPSLFQKILSRLENDYERDRPGLVGEALLLMAGARRGLSEAELLDLLGSEGRRLPQAYWSPLYLATRHLVSNRSGFLALRHEQLQKAVAARDLEPETEEGVSAGSRAIHRRLADYFQEREWGPRRTEELPWQLSQAESWSELADLLGNLDFLDAAFKQSGLDVRRYWAQIQVESPGQMVDQYREALESPEREGGLWSLAALFGSMGHAREAAEIQEAIAEEARDEGDGANLMASLGNHAHSLQKQGQWKEAYKRFSEQEALARELDHGPGLATALGGQAGLLRLSGALNSASELYAEEAELRRKTGDQAGLQYCLGNQAQLLVDQADLEGALNLREEQERIARQIGEVDGMRMAMEAQSVIHRMKGNLELALDLNRKGEEISRGLGDQIGLTTALINQGIILYNMGDADGALERYREAEAICRAIGQKQDLSAALNNQGGILLERGDIEAASRCYKECEEICRSLGYSMGLQAALENQARIALLKGASP